MVKLNLNNNESFTFFNHSMDLRKIIHSTINDLDKLLSDGRIQLTIDIEGTTFNVQQPLTKEDKIEFDQQKNIIIAHVIQEWVRASAEDEIFNLRHPDIDSDESDKGWEFLSKFDVSYPEPDKIAG